MEYKRKIMRLRNDLLEGIAMAMNDSNNEAVWYLDVQKEETVFISEYYAEDEEMLEMIENDYGEERFIAIPARSSHEGWEQMERFILTLDDQDEKTRNLLLTTLQGPGAFGRFKEAVHRIGLQERWYVFKGREDRKDVLDWLYSLDLITTDDIDKGMQLYEELLAKRRQREAGIARMTRGAWVKCIENIGHEAQLTPGKTYEVLDERKEHRNIRLRDDRGNVRWYPKSHFELISLRKA